MLYLIVLVVISTVFNAASIWADRLEARFESIKISSRGSMVSDRNPAKPGVPVLLEATLKWHSLVPQEGKFGGKLEGKQIFFFVERNGRWQPIPDDGITTTNDITNRDGIGSVYFLPPEDISLGSYRVKVFYGGDEEYAYTEDIKTGLIVNLNDPDFFDDESYEMRGPNWFAKKIYTGQSNYSKVPLILIHGNGSEEYELRSSLYRWNKFKEFVFENDFNKFNIYVWKHDTSRPIGFNGCTGNAKELADFIYQKLLIPTRYPQGTEVLLVAHSRGGLVARSFMNYNRQGDDVLGLITLGTPHHGSPLAIPDWSALTWNKEFDDAFPGDILNLSDDIFNFLVGSKKAYDIFISLIGLKKILDYDIANPMTSIEAI